MLWFAFILLSLSYWKQPRRPHLPTWPRCDLLSFYYLCRTGNNSCSPLNPPFFVVICFHFTIFVVLETTCEAVFPSVILLWFAFILLSLSYWKQLQLLPCLVERVVICFHFTIFVVLETTESTLFVVFQYVIKIIGIQKMLFLIECNPADWRDYFFWLNLRIAPIAARECWRP